MSKVRQEIKAPTRKALMNKAIKNKGMHDKDVIAFCAVCEEDLYTDRTIQLVYQAFFMQWLRRASLGSPNCRTIIHPDDTVCQEEKCTNFEESAIPKLCIIF